MIRIRQGKVRLGQVIDKDHSWWLGLSKARLGYRQGLWLAIVLG